MTNLLQSLKILILAVILSIGVSYVYAWTGPTATAPGRNTPAPINVGATSQVKSGGLWVGSLASDGGVRVGSTDATCTTGISGTLRYNSGNIQYCNGSAWGILSAAAPSGAQEWTTAGGPYMFTVPAGVTSVTLSLAAGGGAGAGGDILGDGRIDEITSTRGGGGGSGGQGVLNQMVAVTPGQQIQIRVGSGGAGGGIATAGNAGGNSSFGSVIGLGGSGGQRSAGTNTTWRNTGSVYCRGATGGSGLNGSPSSLAQSVYGASAPGTGGSGGTSCSLNATPGGNAGVYSAGGGGGAVGGSSSVAESSSAGGNGSSGFVRVSW